MKLVINDSSIECISAEIISRKILPSAFVEITNIGRCFAYKCSLNSEAKILKELNPKEQVVCKSSHLNIGTILECDKLYVAIQTRKPYLVPKVVNHSGRHKARKFITKEFTYAKITQQLSNIPYK